MKGWLSCLSEAKVLRGDGEREEFSSLSHHGACRSALRGSIQIII